MIVQLETLDDPRVEAYQHVGEHDWLRSRGLFVAEGRLVVDRLIAAAYDVHSVLVSPAALAALRSRFEVLDAPIYVAGQTLFDHITGFNFHRGCLALARRPEAAPIESLTRSRLLLGLEGIGNPDNVGGLFRTAAAFAVDAVLLDERSGDPFYRKALRTSMGAVLRVPFAAARDWFTTRDLLRRHAFTAVALTIEGSATDLDSFCTRLAADERVLVLVGAEGAGLTPESKAQADERVTIPMAPGVDSLNVVVAAGIALSRIAARLGRKGAGYDRSTV